MTPAMKRALRAATVNGLVREARGWRQWGTPEALAETHRPVTVDALVERGLLSRTIGDARVQLTTAGREALTRLKEDAEWTAAARKPCPAHIRPVRLDWLPVADLRADPAYQRQLGKRGDRMVRDIAAGWDWSRCGAIVVAPAAMSDGWAVIDGQHRMLAARAAGIDELPCVVTGEDAVPGQARAFLGVNDTRQRVTTGARHLAAVAAGDPDAVALQQVLEAAGVTVETRDGYRPGPRSTSAVMRLRAYMRRHGAGVLEDALRLIVAAIPEDGEEALTAQAIEGVCLVVARLRGLEIGEDRLAEVLAETALRDLADNANAIAGREGRKAAPIIARILTRALNHGRRQRIAEEY